jgi:hypothetical protein
MPDRSAMHSIRLSKRLNYSSKHGRSIIAAVTI